MDSKASSQFIASLVKSIQVVCHGNVEFNHNIEIVGHIYLHVDKSRKFNYVLNEEVLKDSDSTKFLSNSFPAEPPSKEPERKRRRAGLPSSPAESDGAGEVITIRSDADDMPSKPLLPLSSVVTASPTVVVPSMSNAISCVRQRPRRSSFPPNQTALPSSESEGTPSLRNANASQPHSSGSGHSGPLIADQKPDVSKQTSTSTSFTPSARESHGGASVPSGGAATTEPDVQIKLEVPSEEEVQLLSHEIVGHLGGPSHTSQTNDPSASPGSGALYPVMLHQNLSAAHARGPDRDSLQGPHMKRSRVESDVPMISSTYSLGQNEFNLHGPNLSSSSGRPPGSQWNQPASSRTLSDSPNDGLAEPMVQFDSSLLAQRLGGGPSSTLTSLSQEGPPGSSDSRDRQAAHNSTHQTGYHPSGGEQSDQKKGAILNPAPSPKLAPRHGAQRCPSGTSSQGGSAKQPCLHRFYCHLCTFFTQSRATFLEHLSDHNKGRSYCCSSCLKMFPTASGRSMHEKSWH